MSRIKTKEQLDLFFGDEKVVTLWSSSPRLDMIHEHVWNDPSIWWEDLWSSNPADGSYFAGEYGSNYITGMVSLRDMNVGCVNGYNDWCLFDSEEDAIAWLNARPQLPD